VSSTTSASRLAHPHQPPFTYNNIIINHCETPLAYTISIDNLNLATEDSIINSKTHLSSQTASHNLSSPIHEATDDYHQRQ
jgi:hypothetical protein